jgi:hypothetical protein
MLLETPGHTGTLGFGRRAPAGTNAGAYRDYGSYPQCGNMLADISDFGYSRYVSFDLCSLRALSAFPSAYLWSEQIAHAALLAGTVSGRR